MASLDLQAVFFNDPGTLLIGFLESLCGDSPLSARFRAILDLLPDVLPFFPPSERAVARRAHLHWQIGFVVRHSTSATSGA